MYLKLLAMYMLCSGVSGCALLGDEFDRAAEGAGELVKTYCENVTSDLARTQFRTMVNAHAAPHEITVRCADGEILSTEGAP